MLIAEFERRWPDDLKKYRVSVDMPLSELVALVQKKRDETEQSTKVEEWKEYMTAAPLVLGWVNKAFLRGVLATDEWHAKVSTNIHRADRPLGLLYKRYFRKGAENPVKDLLLFFIGSLVLCQLQKFLGKDALAAAAAAQPTVPGFQPHPAHAPQPPPNGSFYNNVQEAGIGLPPALAGGIPFAAPAGGGAGMNPLLGMVSKVFGF